VAEGMPWVGKKLTDLDLHGRYELLPLAVRESEGDMKFNPRDDSVAAVGGLSYEKPIVRAKRALEACLVVSSSSFVERGCPEGLFRRRAWHSLSSSSYILAK